MIARTKARGHAGGGEAAAGGLAKSLGAIEDLVQPAAEARREVRSIDEIVADDKLPARLSCRPGQRWLRLITTRSDPKQSGRLISWPAAHLDPTYADAVREQVRHAELDSTIIGQAYGTYAVEIRQEIRAIGVPATIAPSLGCEPEAPALEITRHYPRPCRAGVRDHGQRSARRPLGLCSQLRRVGNGERTPTDHLAQQSDGSAAR